MRTRTRVRTGIVLVCTLLALLATTVRLLAEVPNKSPEKLKELATHIVTGEVVHIYQRSERKGGVRFDRYLAEVRVKAVEPGGAAGAGAAKAGEANGGIIEAESLIYVRYFTKHNPPGVTDTAGHRGLPAEGDSVRMHLARNVRDGYGQPSENSDGGFNVVFPNGFEILSKEQSQ